MTNKIGTSNIKKLIWSMGIPVMLSMILQALYNVIDTMFVINMGSNGTLGNIALSAAFPVQILMIAIGVGTGIGINALLSKNLGQKQDKIVTKVVGNAIFLTIIFYIIFLLIGLFFSKPYMELMSDDKDVILMGSRYLKICCCLSFGALGFSTYERFLMSSGKTLYSTIAQVVGAISNIILDYVFIYPLNMGIEGAAIATVIGQIISLLLAMIFHYTINKDIHNNLSSIKPHFKTIKAIYKIGFPAFLMQAMLSVMMFAVLLVIKTIENEYSVMLLTGSYGIYYKLMQIALFASFGLSNVLISIVSFNYGMKDNGRVKDAIKHGIIASIVVTLFITFIYQVFAGTISNLFAITIEKDAQVSKDDIINSCKLALHIASIGYVFMGISVAIQGILQGFNDVFKPLWISALRLIILVIPIAYLFCLSDNVTNTIWWTFPLSEVITCIISCMLLKLALKKNISEN